MTSSSMHIFDRALVLKHRERATPNFEKHDFLFQEVADRLMDRLDDVNRPFTCALDLGARGNALTSRLQQGTMKGSISQVISMPFARSAPANPTLCVCASEEALPFAPQSFDLVISNLSLHWVNDLPGALLQAKHILRPEGFFLASMWGGETLTELRHCVMEAELEILGGVSPRLSPLVEGKDLGALLQRAGFKLPVIDSDILTVSYDNPLKLLIDLRGMGETNALLQNKRGLRRSVLNLAMKKYIDIYAEPDGRIPATFQVFYLAGWSS